MMDLVDNDKSDLKKEETSQRLAVGKWVLQEER